MIFKEGELEIDFTGALSVLKLDDKGYSIPTGFKVVDFVVEEPKRRLLVELKDPSHSKATTKERKEFAKRLASDQLSHEQLVPKARGSYCFLHLMEQDDKEMVLVVLLAVEQLNHDPALLIALTEKIRKRLLHEATEPWKRRYIKNCIVLTEATWAGHMTYPLARTP